ncbi:hypothetical protein MKK84_09350, partial [Methylobacterium sp. E-065]|uniref:hypothetical protein n=1 Tax=Methylobacterium sp. E-065 TaxID=2836583 RepID=UPI001FBBCBAE
GVLAFGRHASTSGSSSDHCASLSIIPPALKRGNASPASPFRRRQALVGSVRDLSGDFRPSIWLLVLVGVAMLVLSPFLRPHHHSPRA